MGIYKKYFLPLIMVSIISWTSFFVVLLRLEPCRTYSVNFCADPSTLGILLFFLSLFFALTTLFTLIGYLARIHFYKGEMYINQFNIALRQGILLAICSEAAMGLLALDILRWWTALLLFVLILLMEFYFLSSQSF